MEKLFISQPMKDKTDEEILQERKNAISVAKDILKDDVEVIESFFEKVPNVKTKPLWYLGESIKLLSEADVVYFASGWENERGCKIEHTCAVEYGIDRIE